MPFISSPVAYPPSSSPQDPSPRKRKRSHNDQPSPLRASRSAAISMKSNALFVEEPASDDENMTASISIHKDVQGIGKENRPEVALLGLSKDSHGVEHQPALTRGPSLGASIFSRPLHPTQPVSPDSSQTRAGAMPLPATTTKGQSIRVGRRPPRSSESYQSIVAARSETVAGKAKRSYFGIEINSLIEQADAAIAKANEAQHERAITTIVEHAIPTTSSRTLMWTEKYRARKFTDLVGDDRTHRTVMHWLKAWDPIVYPGSARRPKQRKQHSGDSDEKEHRKVLVLTGPPGLGKTTLAHVCARQAGYEVNEINASDERSKDVVKGRIRDMLGTENVRSASDTSGQAKKIAKPICLVVDEVDGVVSGSGAGGDGGFIKALIDLILLDQRNTRTVGLNMQETSGPKKKKGDTFRMLRPLIMICNDVYHPALRLLRTSHLVEIIHCGRPALNNVAHRVQAIFEREGIGADGDAVRRLCEGCWGTTSKKEGGTGAGAGDGDIRSVLVLSEWIAKRVRATESERNSTEKPRLTKKWLEAHLIDPSANGVIRGLGRGGAKEIVDRVFMEGAGLSKIGTTATATHMLAKPSVAAPEAYASVKSVNEAIKSASSSYLRTLVDGHGETDKIMTDLFSQFPSQPYQDDTFLTKPTQAYDWLHFHDQLSSAVYSSSEWELAPYLSSPVVGFHNLFATNSTVRARHASDSTSNYSKATTTHEHNPESTTDETHPFTTPQASFLAHEREKANAALLLSLHDSLSLPLTRLFPRPSTMAAEFIPFVLRMLSPAVNPVLITSSAAPGASKFDNKTTASVRKASEKQLVDRSVRALMATGLRFHRHRIEGAAATPASAGRAAGGFVYRMSLPLDEYGLYGTGAKGLGNDVGGISAPGNRYAVRQVLVQECAKEERRCEEGARRRRQAGGHEEEEEEKTEVVEEKKGKKGKRDFFGREVQKVDDAGEQRGKKRLRADSTSTQPKVWVSFHEGYSNAVRKPITLAELIRGM